MPGRRSRRLVALCAAAAALLAAPASAAPLRFTITGSVNATIDFDSNPTPVATSPGNYFVALGTNATGDLAGSPTLFGGNMAFFTTSYNNLTGGLVGFYTTTFSRVGLGSGSVFTGPVTAPTFTPGTYDFYIDSDLNTLTIAALPTRGGGGGGPGAPAPELGATWAAALAAGLAIVLTRRRQPVTA